MELNTDLIVERLEMEQYDGALSLSADNTDGEQEGCCKIVGGKNMSMQLLLAASQSRSTGYSSDVKKCIKIGLQASLTPIFRCEEAYT